MAHFSKFKLLFALKYHFNGGQVYKEILKFGYFKKLEKVRIKWQRQRKLTVEII